MMSINPEWIAVDWGTSQLRAWAVRKGDVLAKVTSDEGMGRLKPAEFEAALLRLIDPWLSADRVDVIACGMVGARQGWQEAAYKAVPTHPLDAPLTRISCQREGLNVFIVPGLKQISQPDVMRGEETQIAGFLSQDPDFEGGVCLPGTHTKWAMVQGGQVESFKTFMTGELFSLLSTYSVLRHSVDTGWDQQAFLSGFRTSFLASETVTAELFGLRASSLLQDTSGAAGRSRLSGLLIGVELSAQRSMLHGHRLAVIGSERICSPYMSALQSEGFDPDYRDGDDMTLLGLTEVYRVVKELV